MLLPVSNRYAAPCFNELDEARAILHRATITEVISGGRAIEDAVHITDELGIVYSGLLLVKHEYVAEWYPTISLGPEPGWQLQAAPVEALGPLPMSGSFWLPGVALSK